MMPLHMFPVTVALVLGFAFLGLPMTSCGQPPSSPPSTAGSVSQEASLEELAAQLLPKLNLPSGSADVSGLSHAAREGLRPVAEALAAKQPVKALVALGEYYRQKLLHQEAFGIPPEVTDLNAGYSGPFGPLLDPKKREKTVALANALLATTGEGRTPQPNPNDTPLVRAFLYTGDRRYLIAWIARMDDWALQKGELSQAWPLGMRPGQSKGAAMIWEHLKYWGGVAIALKDDPKAFPATTFLRVLNKLMPDYPLATMAYHRGEPRNWTIENTYFYCTQGRFFEEFRIGPELLREGVRVLESYATTHLMRDGTENQQMLGYNFMYLTDAGQTLLFLDALKRFDPSLLDAATAELLARPWWREIVQATRRDCAIRLLRMAGADGRGPIGLRSDRRSFAFDLLEKSFPEVSNDPESRRILDFFHWHKGATPSISPLVTSETFPYGGYTWMREGWGSRDANVFMFCSPRPGAASGFLSERNNNAIGLQAYGQDLIVTGDHGAYTKRRSPLRVDGYEQAFHLGLGAPLAAWDQPGNNRFHQSAHLILAEGSYSGPYGERRRGMDDPDANLAAYTSSIRDVSHRRQVTFLRSERLWIVTDEVKSATSHKYTLDWRLPLEPTRDKSFKPFAAGEITVSEPEAKIVTTRHGNANVAISLFGPKALRMEQKEERYRGKGVSDALRIGATWEGSNEPIIVSLIEPFQGTQPPTKAEPLNAGPAAGFRATTSSGSKVGFVASGSCADLPAQGAFSVRAERFAVVEKADGSSYGLALGCERLLWKGKGVHTPCRDFEFVRDQAGKWSFTSIHRPLATVEIEPKRNLLKPGEAVTLRCPEANMTIRYTLDGTPVTGDSPRYEKPIEINDPCWLRTRAFRQNVEQVPPEHSGTHVSPESRAVFSRATEQWAAQPSPALSTLKPGLAYKYYEGRWQDLWCVRPVAPCLASGSAPLFGAPHRPKTPADFLHEYEGFLVVPAGGIYTFEAPEDYTHDNTAAGYELDIRIDGHRWYPATSRHAFGTWSVPLAAGAHRLQIRYLDFRRDGVERFNRPGLNPNRVWDGQEPPLLISGPGLDKPQRIPSSWLRH